MKITRRHFIVSSTLVAISAIALAFPPVRRVFHPLTVRLRGRRTVDERVAEFADAGKWVWHQCQDAGVAYPPGRVVLLGLKDEKQLQVYAGPAEGELRLIAIYPVLAASGVLGPKLREGDRQVPEGVYAIESLNPNSRFHAALRVAYPNDFDRKQAEREGRTNLGGDIMIHGGAASIGCLAMGDPAAEQLFVLAANTGLPNVAVILAPLDLRHRPLPAELATDDLQPLYDSIVEQMNELHLPLSQG